MRNPFNPGYYSEIDLKDAGFKSLGRNVRIARNCVIIGLENIEIGDNVRIDCFCSLIAEGSGWLSIGSFVHVGGGSHLSAGAGIRMDDFSGVSQGVRIYSKSDDYTGKHLTNPTVPTKYTGVTHGTVSLGRHVIVGSGSVILPNVSIGEGSSVGALTLVVKSLDPWGVYSGTPARKLKSRSKELLELEKQFRNELPRKSDCEWAYDLGADPGNENAAA
jgi:acetyltransferase-like isoleucine patch superfamily enzyme